MPISFSEYFEIPNDLVESTGVFDTILDVDTHVFIDPALLELCKEPEFINARATVEKYFSNIIALLSHSSKIGDMFWKKADKLLAFKEISGTCLGYSRNGTSGNAIGKVLRSSVLNTIKSLITEGKADPVLFELLGVFQERIGCDRVSDLLTFILRKEILEYTHRVVTKCNVSDSTFILEKTKYNVCRNPFNDKSLLLLPATILSPLPIADSFDDIDWICQENERVRQAINEYFDLGQKKKISKSQILRLMRENTDFRNTLISSYKSAPKYPYNFVIDPAGEYCWYTAARGVVEKYPLKLTHPALNSFDDVMTITRKICNQFKSLIEDNNLSQLLYNEDGKPKRESAAQLLFFGIADGYCTANNLDLTKEGNNGRGPVDFKLSRGAQDKVIVEAKLTSNPQLKHGVEIQVPTYMKQEKTKQAIYLIIDTGHEKSLKGFEDWYKDLDNDVKNKIKYIVIDATSKPSASRA